MNFEVMLALKLINKKTNPYLVREALDDYDITYKRYAREILFDLTPTDATELFIEKVRLY
ncbi:MAG: hypothetical protein P1V97_15740 [Planctomycetota bacterium]|nr:hypothetical protein [Planctomycetota bacterium]